MARSTQQGLQDHEILDRSNKVQDTRSLTTRAIVLLQEPQWAVLTVVLLAAAAAIVPMAWPIFWLSAAGISLWRVIYARFYDRLPLRQPFFLKMKDPQDQKPDGTYYKSRGTIYVGNDINNDKEVWITVEDALNHVMIFGATGAGKSELMLALSFIYIAAGSGLFYVDPKASIKMNAQFQVMARMCGRDDDFRLMNFMTAGMPTRHKRPERWPEKRTNSTNQLSFLPKDACVQLVASLMPQTEGPNAIFSQNAMTLLTGLMYALVSLREKGELELSMGVLRTYLDKEKIVELAQRTDIEADVIGLRTFLAQMGYQSKLPMEKQPRQFTEQFSYAANYFNQALTSLIETYGDIFETTAGDIDMIDVVLNRRIVLALLPSLEKSPQECATLGKINLSAIRYAISIGLGDRPEGTIDESVNSLPMNADFPFASITDEFAALGSPEGYAEVATQGRGLGISAIIGSQDAPGIRLSDEKGFGQLIANTRLKAFGRIADQETMDLLQKLAGEALVTVQQNLTRRNERAGGGKESLNYRRGTEIAIEERSRIAQIDVQKQVQGQYTLFLDGRIVRVRTFYGNIPLEPQGELRLNRLVCPKRPDIKNLSLKYGPVRHIIDSLNRYGREPALLNAMIQEGPAPRADILAALRLPFRRGNPLATWSPMDRALVAFMGYAKCLESVHEQPPETAKEVVPTLSGVVAQAEA